MKNVIFSVGDILSQVSSRTTVGFLADFAAKILIYNAYHSFAKLNIDMTQGTTKDA